MCGGRKSRIGSFSFVLYFIKSDKFLWSFTGYRGLFLIAKAVFIQVYSLEGFIEAILLCNIFSFCNRVGSLIVILFLNFGKRCLRGLATYLLVEDNFQLASKYLASVDFSLFFSSAINL